jgi:hypothetical protein
MSMLFRRTQLVHYASLRTHSHRKIHQTFSWVCISTVTLFYLTTLIQSFLRTLRVTAGNAALADIPIRNQTWSVRLRSTYKLYHGSFLSYVKVTEMLSFGSETRLTSNKHVFRCHWSFNIKWAEGKRPVQTVRQNTVLRHVQFYYAGPSCRAV